MFIRDMLFQNKYVNADSQIKSSETAQSILSDQNEIELELNNLINGTFLSNLWIENILK